jgi:hypothetical protein
MGPPQTRAAAAAVDGIKGRVPHDRPAWALPSDSGTRPSACARRTPTARPHALAAFSFLRCQRNATGSKEARRRLEGWEWGPEAAGRAGLEGWKWGPEAAGRAGLEGWKWGPVAAGRAGLEGWQWGPVAAGRAGLERWKWGPVAAGRAGLERWKWGPEAAGRAAGAAGEAGETGEAGAAGAAGEAARRMGPPQTRAAAAAVATAMAPCRHGATTGPCPRTVGPAHPSPRGAHGVSCAGDNTFNSTAVEAARTALARTADTKDEI